MYKVRRLIRFFEKTSDKYVGEIELPEIELSELQKLFNEDRENPMYDCYPITTNEHTFFIQFLDKPLELDKYNYFLEADTYESK